MRILQWSLTIGAVGFVSGFLGPIFLNPDANQGPLLGLFFTGPIALVLGALAGLVVSAFRPDPRQNRISLLIASSIVALATLIACFPEPRYLGFVVEGEIRTCAPPAGLAQERIEWWSNAGRSGQAGTPRPDWENDVARMLAEDRGVVLGLFVHRKRELYEHRKPWNKGLRKATPWETVDALENYYARFHGDACNAYEAGERRLFFPAWEYARTSPPDSLPAFLGLYILQDIPDEYRPLITE